MNKTRNPVVVPAAKVSAWRVARQLLVRRDAPRLPEAVATALVGVRAQVLAIVVEAFAPLSRTLRTSIERAAGVIGHALDATTTLAYGSVFPERTAVAHLPE